MRTETSNELSVTVSIGASNTRYVFDPDTPLSKVRTLLTSDGKLPPDSETEEFRFVAGQSQSTSSDDAIISKSVESVVPIKAVLSRGNLLVATNQIATRIQKPDLMGIGTDWLFDRFLGVNISLNTSDPAALEQNKAIGAIDAAGNVVAAPFLITKAKPTSKAVTGVWDNVCVCVEGSCVAFTINSWGAVGYSIYIAQDEGTPVANDDLFQAFGSTPNQYQTSYISRYASIPQNIEIVGSRTAQIAPNGPTVRFQKVTFRTRRMTSYEQNGRLYASNQRPAPPLNLLRASLSQADRPDDVILLNLSKGAPARRDIVVLPGSTITPGGPVPGPTSSADWGAPISNAVIDDASQPMGEVVVFFFVFDNLEDAKLVIDRYNVPDPSLWL